MMNKEYESKNIEMIKWFLSYIKPYKGLFLISMITSGGLITANLLKAYFIKELVDYGLEGDLYILLKTLVKFGLLILGGTLFSYLSKLSAGKISLSIIEDLKNKLADHISKIELEELEEIQSGDLASRLNNDTDMIKQFINNSLPQFSTQMIMGIGASLYIGFINWKLLLATLMFLPLGIFAADFLNKRARVYYPESYKYLGQAAGMVEESIPGIEIIKAFNLKKIFAEKLKKKYNQVFQTELNAFKYVSVLQPVCYALANFPRLISLIAGGYMASRGELEVGTLIAAYHLTEFIIIPAVSYPFVKNNINRSIAAIERVEEILSISKESTDGHKIQDKSTELAISFQDVSFSYRRSNTVLENLSFELYNSQMTALVGVSGSGKSTIVDLICRLYLYQGGSIKIFGNELKSIAPENIRHQIAVVSQDTYLFPGTITENIGYGKSGATEEDILAAAKAANAHQFIEKLANGYQTQVGEGGNNLSGGQKQRISLARAFLKDAPIIILDEPTSSLDNHSEQLIQKSIEELIEGRTVLVIAHRLSTIMKADQILVLDNGRIVEKGRHQQLVKKEDLYYQLYNNQLTDKEVVEYA